MFFNIILDESKNSEINIAHVTVLRERGSFNRVTCQWYIDIDTDNGTNITDLSPTTGELMFDVGVTSQIIELIAVADMVRV